mmetsp:Transcript_2545/g.6737  ORF Transcript_2545/g.6737 Transcript_2545/m.6737 type:complete len:342 (+) Transcript_2545:286-1311(+)
MSARNRVLGFECRCGDEHKSSPNSGGWASFGSNSNSSPPLSSTSAPYADPRQLEMPPSTTRKKAPVPGKVPEQGSWSSDHPWVKELKRQILDGTIPDDLSPKMVWLQNPHYQLVPLNVFRNNLNRYKREMRREGRLPARTGGAAADEDSVEDHGSDDDPALVIGPSSAPYTQSREHTTSGAQLHPSTPSSLISRHVTEGGTECIDLAVILPSGVDPSTITLIVEGQKVRIEWNLPFDFTDVPTLMRMWMKKEGFAIYHPRCVGFETTLKSSRDSRHSVVRSVAFIDLPITVESTIFGIKVFVFDSGLNVLMVQLRAKEDAYAVRTPGKVQVVVQSEHSKKG